MPEASLDLCNPFAIVEAFIQFLTGNSPSGTQTQTQAPSVERAPILREPELRIEEVTGANPFQLCKPNYEMFARSVPGHPTFTVIKSFATRAAAETEKQKLPRLRLAGTLKLQPDAGDRLTELPANQQFDWTNDPDAKNISKRFDDLRKQISIAPAPSPASFRVVMARLAQEVNSSHMPDPEDATKSLILIDPFQTSGLFELIVSFFHELGHAEYHQRRKFLSQELAGLLLDDEFLMVELEEERACFQNEKKAIQQIIDASPPEVQQQIRENVVSVTRSPAAFYFAPQVSALSSSRLDDEVNKQIVHRYRDQIRDIYKRATRNKIVPGAAADAWLKSPEWATIQQTRPVWQSAGAF